MKKIQLYIVLIILIICLPGFILCKEPLKYAMSIIGRQNDEIQGVFVNKMDTKVATCSADGTIKIWSLPDGKELLILKGHSGPVYNVSFSGNDKLLASASADHTIRIWDVETGKEIKKLTGQSDQVIGVYFSQDDKSSYVASTSFDKIVRMWDIESGREIKKLIGHTEQTNNVAYSYDGKYIASCSDDKTVRIWSTDFNNNKEVKILIDSKFPVLTVLFSFDNKYLISGNQDGEIIIWSIPDFKFEKNIKAHYGLIQDISISEDDRTIVTSSHDKKVKLWDITTGSDLLSFDVDIEVWAVDIVSDASIIIIGCKDGTIRFLTKESKD
jgi:WD40 repeat protein